MSMLQHPINSDEDPSTEIGLATLVSLSVNVLKPVKLMIDVRAGLPS